MKAMGGTFAVAALAAAVTGCAMQSGSGWTTLIDGTRGLDNFNRVGEAKWTARDGAIEASAGGKDNAYLVTKNSYSNFTVRVEFWASDDANSGVFIRCEDPKTITAANAYEVNIYDKRPDQSYRTGAIVDVAKPASVIMTGGKWNTFDITARGTKFTVLINGMPMVDVSDSKHARGPIALQYGAGTVKFRNVRIRTL